MLITLKDRYDLPAELNRINFLGVGVEVGSLRGDFAAYLLKNWNGKRLYLIDAWRYTPGAHDGNNADPEGQRDNMSAAFRAVYEFGSRAVIVRDSSVMASQLFPDGVLDFVYIDAAHDYESVKDDLRVWIPKVRPGGLVIGDDYAHGTWAHGKKDGMDILTDFEVKLAVDEYVKEKKVQLFLTEDEKPQWWFFKE